ncbi:MAG TPA: M1 family metallopeptidase [Pyrinomonadaceae bacterium]|jgi:aminopeptidase N|nr:M1 family metallopeptidase [Pyrinomonadaceae bacterium]
MLDRLTKTIIIGFWLLLITAAAIAQVGPVTRAETLRGTITPEREWWDVQHYDLSVQFLPDTRSIKGSNVITFKRLKAGSKMQIDLQMPLAITNIIHNGVELKFEREGDVYWVTFDKEVPAGIEDKISIWYEGHPVEAKNPPWTGGVQWAHDDLGRWFINTSCEGIGASIWWPNKDIGYDEPDRGMNINITVPDDLVDVSNGRLIGVDHDVQSKTKTFHWQVKNPINNYGVNANIGHYVSWTEKYPGVAGPLDLTYYVLDHQKAAAMRQFKEVPRMIKAFEYWFGKYPFYEDGYKLVAVEYLGMEHQSSVTYGNWFMNGYRGRDLSGTGVGLKWDFIIVHESGHEWFGNNISMKDAADMWIHEGFTAYSETLFTDYYWGNKAGDDYLIGTRRNIRNAAPIIETYGANRQPNDTDQYYKSANMLHTIRQVINDDAKFRSILTGLNRDFYHQTVTTQQIESDISQKSGIDFSKVFDQYLRTIKIPRFEYKIDQKKLTFEWKNVVDGFDLPLKVAINGKDVWLKPTDRSQAISYSEPIRTVIPDRNFHVDAKESK